MKQLLLLLTITSLLLVGGCSLFPSDLELPPITMDGRNTFGCLVDGKLFLPEAPIGFGTGISAAVQTAIDTIGINIQAGNIDTDQSFFLSIYDSPTLQVGKSYDLTNSEFFVQFIHYQGNLSCEYRNISSGVINISKFDISGINKIVAGTFEFTATSSDCTTTIKVTKGRFDIGDID